MLAAVAYTLLEQVAQAAEGRHAGQARVSSPTVRASYCSSLAFFSHQFPCLPRSDCRLRAESELNFSVCLLFLNLVTCDAVFRAPELFVMQSFRFRLAKPRHGKAVARRR
jgi:hypothetical protein